MTHPNIGSATYEQVLCTHKAERMMASQEHITARYIRLERQYHELSQLLSAVAVGEDAAIIELARRCGWSEVQSRPMYCFLMDAVDAYCVSPLTNNAAPQVSTLKSEHGSQQSAAEPAGAAPHSGGSNPQTEIETIEQALLEMEHAHCDPHWFSKGQRGADDQFRLWKSKGSEAVKTLKASLSTGGVVDPANRLLKAAHVVAIKLHQPGCASLRPLHREHWPKEPCDCIASSAAGQAVTALVDLVGELAASKPATGGKIPVHPSILIEAETCIRLALENAGADAEIDSVMLERIEAAAAALNKASATDSTSRQS